MQPFRAAETNIGHRRVGPRLGRGGRRPRALLVQPHEVIQRGEGFLEDGPRQQHGRISVLLDAIRPWESLRVEVEPFAGDEAAGVAHEHHRHADTADALSANLVVTVRAWNGWP